MERKDKKKYSILLKEPIVIDEHSIERYKKVLLLRAVCSFLLILFIIVERIFIQFLKPYESQLVGNLQSLFDINSYKDDGLPGLFLAQFLHNTHYFSIVLLHCYLVLYYWSNVIISMKVMIAHYLFLTLMTNFEQLFSDPRPFWEYSTIIGVVCEASYAFPSYSVCAFSFLILFATYCLQHDQELQRNQENVFKERIKWIVWLTLIGIYCFFTLVMGLSYLSQVFLALFFSLLIFFLVNFFEKSLNDLVMKSTLEPETSKRYCIYWSFFAICAVAVATIVYFSVSTLLDIKWYKNIVKAPH